MNNVTDLNLPFKNAILLLSDDKEGVVKVNVIRDHNDKLALTFVLYHNIGDTNCETTANGYMTSERDFILGYSDNNAINEKHKNIIKLMVYLFYGDITLKKLLPKTSTRLTSITKFKNDTKTGIWFANTLWKQSISTEGFKVKGHFRLQPCGVGRKERKLIWIESFKKEGYNRKATREQFKTI